MTIDELEKLEAETYRAAMKAERKLVLARNEEILNYGPAWGSDRRSEALARLRTQNLYEAWHRANETWLMAKARLKDALSWRDAQDLYSKRDGLGK
jgi:hypothetical protein